MPTNDAPLQIAALRSLSLELGQGGGEPLLLQALDGNLNNGSRVRISTDGTYAIGAKPGGAHELHDFGDTAYEKGAENNFNSGVSDDIAFANTEPARVWTSIVSGDTPPAPVLKSDAGLQRHQYASRFYRLFGHKASLREPLAFEQSGRNAGYRTIYHAWWQRAKYNALYWRDVNPSSVTGTFQADEPLTVNGGEFSGVFVSYDAGRTRPYRVVIETGQQTSNDLVGKTVTGVNSGASFTFPSDFSLPGQYKIGRWWDNPNGEFVRTSLALNDGYVANSQNATRPVEFFDKVDMVAGAWQLYELELDMDAGYFRHMVDGRVRHEQSGFSAYGDPSFSFAVSQVGTDGLGFEEQITDIAESVFDTTLYRVYMTANSTWSWTDHRELQRLIAWDGTVDVALNYGALSIGYLYLIGADGQPINTTGLEVV